MDLQEILSEKIRELPAGPFLDGLQSVRSHIDAATRHFFRGQKEGDDSLFTDVIFRCNQAFEGSIKEAYRVLAAKNPHNTTPAEIENFLLSSKLLRKKVLDQVSTYRKEWRNPSTHDYTLDFDEGEALVAIVSVTTFAIVLCDQIESKLAFDASATVVVPAISIAEKEGSLLDLATAKVLAFAKEYEAEIGFTNSAVKDYYRLEGALAGYLSASLVSIPKVTVTQGQGGRDPDIVIQKDAQKIVIELKRNPSKIGLKVVVNNAVTQTALYLHEPDVVGAVAFIYSAETKEYEVAPASGALANSVRIISPIITK